MAPRSEQAFELADLDLHLRINRLVRFQVYTSSRHDEKKLGDVVELAPEELHALPPLETVAMVSKRASGELVSTIPVALNVKLNELGLLQVSCRSLAPDIPQSWPLEFNLRPHERDPAAPAREPASQTQADPVVTPDVLADAGRWISAAFTRPW